jgi:hypothetical protein
VAGKTKYEKAFKKAVRETKRSNRGKITMAQGKALKKKGQQALKAKPGKIPRKPKQFGQIGPLKPRPPKRNRKRK